MIVSLRASRLLATMSCALVAAAAIPGSAPAQSSSQDLATLAKQAYIYAYPLVVMGMTRPVMTNVVAPRGSLAPMNQLVLMRAYPDAAFKDVVSPNADTLYVSGWMDLGKEPLVLRLPAMPERYALFPMLNMWTNIFQSPGMRTTGTGEQTYLITGPKWEGTVPEGMTRYASATRYVWMIGRIYCTGTPADYKAVHAIQDKIRLVPLSAWGTAYTPPAGVPDASVNMKMAPIKQVNAMNGEAYFTKFAQLLVDNPPLPADAPILPKLKRLGIVPGMPLDWQKLDPAVVAALNAAAAAGPGEIAAFYPKSGKNVNGWIVSRGLGNYGTNYMLRASVADWGLGANLDADAMYPTIAAPLDGTKNYVMHFAKGMLPPAKAFWSLTLYNSSRFFYDNPLNKYTVSPRDSLKSNADGSVDIYIQHPSPGASKQANWLPAPDANFYLMLRVYWPKSEAPSIVDGTWEPPAVTAAT
jgi:hypothetical protein